MDQETFSKMILGPDAEDLSASYREEVMKVARHHTALIESFCEQSLIDDKQRGVLVIENLLGGEFTVRLDPRVPYGHIYIVKKEEDLERFVSTPTEGDRST